MTACAHQRVCGATCRARRRNRLARRRRLDDLDEQRVDERSRQRKRRDVAKGAGCHELASDSKQLELQYKLRGMVDRISALSRATFRREAMHILRKCGPFLLAEVDGVGRRHELPSATDAAENGCRSVADVDSVTDRHGSG